MYVNACEIKNHFIMTIEVTCSNSTEVFLFHFCNLGICKWWRRRCSISTRQCKGWHAWFMFGRQQLAAAAQTELTLLLTHPWRSDLVPLHALKQTQLYKCRYITNSKSGSSFYKLTFTQLLRKFFTFYLTHSSLRCSQKPNTGNNPVPE